MTSFEKAETLLNQFMVVPTGGAYTINFDHGRNCALKLVFEVQNELSRQGIFSNFWRETGIEIENIYKKYLQEYKNNDGK